MTDTTLLTDLFKNAPTATSLSGLSVLCANTSGTFVKILARAFAEALAEYLFNPSVLVTNIDEMVNPGIFKVASYSMNGTMPNIMHSNFGHLIVLKRDTTVQQILVTRSGICLRFKTESSDWEDWKIISAA